MTEQIRVPVRLDAAAFREFSYYDTFQLRKRWRSPVIFAAILTASAMACFALNNGSNQGYLLGIVLLVVGLGLPLVYFVQYFSSVKAQAKAQKLDTPRQVYTVVLGDEGVSLRVGENNSPVTAWADVYGAWKVRGYIYLYLNVRQAVILPAGQAPVSDEKLWAFLEKNLPAEKLHLDDQ